MKAKKITLQRLVNAVSRDGHARSIEHAKVDTSGPINVPANVSVEGNHRQIHVAPIQEGDGR